ncbi:beta-glucanase/beta-glucan synthetase [Pseudomonas sp. GM79]|uniref:family 16 glycosylhydrolase n=1 Tax=Pseudomonas sp. GM79 TaxID=1144338 RepID=UPI00026FC1E3|nr:family 16 glycosylhydrolase [Pseudomonas sp. GM79]EJN19818.1 beta-glucanase/beta-glucan synthetase [Pseudomonas sp. GM79]
MSRFILLATLLSIVCNASGGTPPPPLANGLVLWLDAADASTMTLDTQNHLLRWHDKSGQANDVTVDNGADAALPKRVENAMNGHPVVRLSGTSAFLGKAIRTAKGPVTLLIVSRRLNEQSGGETWQRLFSSRPIIADNDNVPPNFAISVQQRTAYDPTLFVLELNDVPIGPYAVGRNVVGSVEHLRGDIAEILMYDQHLASLEDRQRVFQYLANKWSVALPKAANSWTRVGPLGTVPELANGKLPLSDQGNAGQWMLDTRFSDDFDDATLNASRWHVNNATGTDSLGRKPALFMPDNAYLSDGHLNIVFRKQTLPQKYVKLGFEGYSSAMVRTIERSFYGYYEARAKPMDSAGSSAFWLAFTGLADNATEIDIFEIGGKTKNASFDRRYNMNAHVWATPQSTEHLSDGNSWISPWRLASAFHVYGFDWQPDTLRWYVDGVLVREAKNTHWFFPMHILFDSEAMWQWFGVVDDADLPSTFSVDYLKVWRRGR